MVRPELEKWNQTVEDMRRLSLEAEHPRSRERFQALYIISSNQKNASQWARQTHRQKQTVLGWVHRYNEYGPDRLHYQPRGGQQPSLSEAEKKRSSKR
jgi:transposase